MTKLPRALSGPVWHGGRVELHRLSTADARVQITFVQRRDTLRSSTMAAFPEQVAGRRRS